MRTCAGCVFVFVLSVLSFAQLQDKQKAGFPSNEEIQLVLTQAERAFDQYKLSVAAESELPSSKKDPSALEKDRQLVEMYPKLIDPLKKNPSAFNGLGGLLLLTTLDDASRNAALCASSGMTDVSLEAISKMDSTVAYRILAVTKSCIDVSSHLYTVSESVNALFVRYMEAQEDLGQQALEALNRCGAALKSAAPKK
jgi:hypothetical protein